MIDTIKVGIPLSEGQLSKLVNQVQSGESWQWVQWNPQSGELRYMRYKGLAEVDHNSFHRTIYWDIPDHYKPDDTFLTVELSLPKFTYGHNIRLLYGWVDALKDLKRQLQENLHCRFPDVMQWQLRRLDPCYMWQCPSQRTAQGLIDSLKRLRYPRKSPTIQETSIFFKGNTYSVKMYLKLPEFRVHDMKELLKGKALLEWIECLEGKATGVIRFEATLRQKFLSRKGIKTVGDLARDLEQIHWELEAEVEDFNEHIAFYTVMKYQGTKLEGFTGDARHLYLTHLKNGARFSAPPHSVSLPGKSFYFPGGGFTYLVKDNCTALLEYFLEKFIGKNQGMDQVGQVRAKLLQVYNSNKATRLLGFWLHIQKLGIEDAKQMYTKPTFYRNKADLKKADISLIETVLTTNLDEEFVESFKFKIPSNHCTNQYDDFKNHSNLLNEKPNEEDEP